MSTIQQAAKRLEELRRAGVAIPWDADDAPGGEKTAAEAVAAALAAENSAAAQAAPAAPVRNTQPIAPVPASKHSELVTLDLPRLAQQGYLVPGHINTQLGEEFRVIKRPLIRNAQNKGAAPVEQGNLIVVTSALPGEGKTFFAMNLALSLAMELDASALLVEADILRPSVMTRLGLETRHGLLDLLTNRSLDVADVMLRTNIPKLSLLPAGSHSMQTTELLASKRMGEFLDDLASRYRDRIIVFDAPPLLMTSEARVLAARAGQVVVVVEAGRTTHAAFDQAMATIESHPVVMTALNKTKESQSGLIYGYGTDPYASDTRFGADSQFISDTNMGPK
ncbi:MAG: hypothetical protein RLZZ618_3071 [Pseudomonadota bacterium]|jgi:receptor protein-tyrosine kinase